MAFSRERGRAGAAVVLAILLLFGRGLVSRTEAAPGDRMLDWRETVRIEHDDRRRRLQRLSAMSMLGSPRFYETLISRADLPPELGVDIPVLRVVFPERVFFDTAEDALRPEGLDVIEIVAKALRSEASDTAVFIAGHTDRRGSAAYNYDLSVRRAETVARMLKGAGVRQAKIWRIGFGKAVPLVAGDTEAAWGRNRRVEILFARRPEALGAWAAKQRVLVCAGAPPREREICLRDFDELPVTVAIPVTSPQERPGVASPGPAERTTAGLPTPDPGVLRPVTPPRLPADMGPGSPGVAGGNVPPRGTASPGPGEPPRVPTTMGPGESGVAGSDAPARGTASRATPETTGSVTIRQDETIVVDMRQERVSVARP